MEAAPVPAQVVPAPVRVVGARWRFWSPTSPDVGSQLRRSLETSNSDLTDRSQCLQTLIDKAIERMFDNGIFKKALHNPPHFFVEDALYMLTASTYKQQPYLHSAQHKLDWIGAFLKASKIYQWSVIAWVVLDNHYHAILRSPENQLNMDKFVGSYHKFIARKWNNEDLFPGRKIWWNYWDTCIRSEKDYLARLSYIFLNPVKNGLVDEAEDYAFSNYKDFLSVDNWAGLVSDGDIHDIPEF